MNLQAKNPLDLGISKQTTMAPSDRLPFDATAKERAVLGIPKPGNVFGSGVHQPRQSALKISPATVARRYAADLIHLDQINSIREVMGELQKVQDLIDRESPTISENLTRQRAEDYARTPCEKTRRALMESKALSPADHALAQEFAVLKWKELLAKLSPLVRPLLLKVEALMEADLAALESRELAESHAWEASGADSPLLTALHVFLGDVRASARVNKYQNVPPLVVEVVRLAAEHNK